MTKAVKLNDITESIYEDKQQKQHSMINVPNSSYSGSMDLAHNSNTPYIANPLPSNSINRQDRDRSASDSRMSQESILAFIDSQVRPPPQLNDPLARRKMTMDEIANPGARQTRRSMDPIKSRDLSQIQQ